MLRKKIKIVVVDDKPLFRTGIKQLLKEYPQIKIVGEKDSTKDLTSFIKTHSPDAILLDIDHGLEKTTQVLKKKFPNIKVLSPLYHNPASLPFCRVRKESHLVLSDRSEEMVSNAKTDMVRVVNYITELIFRPILEDLVQEKVIDPKINQPILTRREEEILQLQLKGYKRTQIADILRIGVRTYDTYRDRLSNKLDEQRNPETFIKNTSIENSNEVNRKRKK